MWERQASDWLLDCLARCPRVGFVARLKAVAAAQDRASLGTAHSRFATSETWLRLVSMMWWNFKICDTHYNMELLLQNTVQKGAKIKHKPPENIKRKAKLTIYSFERLMVCVVLAIVKNSQAQS